MKVGNSFLYDRTNGQIKEITKEECVKTSFSFVPIVSKPQKPIMGVIGGRPDPNKEFKRVCGLNYEDLIKEFNYRKLGPNFYCAVLRNNQFMFVTIDKTMEDVKKFIDRTPNLKVAQAKTLLCKKKVYRVKIEPSVNGQKYYNQFEDAHYVGDGVQMVITGTRGEQWLIKPEKVAAKYKCVNGNIYETLPSAETVEAMPVPDGTKVTTSWGTVLTAKNSIKVWPQGKNPDNDAWLVERNIFNDTYQRA